LRKKLSSRSAIIMDASTGRAIYAHAPDRPAQPASTIKVLTGLISIKTLGQNDWVPVSRHAAGMPSSKVHLKAGRNYRANDLINAVLLSSANDASVALAEKIGGSESAFARLMTDTAAKLGARHTVCKTASGLTAKGQQSTAQDLALLFNAAMKNPGFASRVARTKVQTSYGTTLKNHNKALWRVRGTEGGKTGYTSAARQTYVGKFRRPEGELLVAVMGSETMWNDVAMLVEFGFKMKKQEQAALIPVTTTANTLAKVRSDLLDQYGGLRVLADSRKSSSF
jgi:D-alanyl-D-alanine carboxypeptidase (penicillin-binding protein 5/6)